MLDSRKKLPARLIRGLSMTNRLVPKSVIMTTVWGRYTWIPSLKVVEYKAKGQRDSSQIALLPHAKNNEEWAIVHAVKHLIRLLPNNRD